MLKLGDATPTITRRGFLISAVSAGFTMAFAWPQTGLAAITGLAAPFEPTLWYDIDRDGMVTVNIIRAEMGQHVGTALARIVADELEADWASVRLRYVDTDPKWGTMVTGGSWSVWQSFPYLSQAGAAGRIAEPDIQIEHGNRCAVQIEQTFDEGRTMRQRHWTHRVYDAFHIADGKTERAPPGIEQQNFA